MPRPFETIKWGLESVDRALKQSEGQTTIPREALDVFKNFQREFGASRNSMREAMAQEIRWLNDGRVFPWSIEPARPQIPKYDEAEKYHLRIAGSLQSNYRAFAEVLNRADNDRTLSYDESQKLRDMMIGLKAGIETLVDGVENLRESKWNNKHAYELFDTIKNQVNDSGNDRPFGPFGTLVKFGADEAKRFVDYLNFQVTDWEKKKEVLTTAYDTAASEFGNLVLDRAGADVLKQAAENLGIQDLDWSKAINAFKNEHPIVALYAVAIDDAMANGASRGELEVMLRTGRAALSELRNEFITRGPRTVDSDVAPGAATMALAGPSHRAERATVAADLERAVGDLARHLGVQ
jgi:hypothetical protein